MYNKNNKSIDSFLYYNNSVNNKKNKKFTFIKSTEKKPFQFTTQRPYLKFFISNFSNKYNRDYILDKLNLNLINVNYKNIVLFLNLFIYRISPLFKVVKNIIVITFFNLLNRNICLDSKNFKRNINILNTIYNTLLIGLDTNKEFNYKTNKLHEEDDYKIIVGLNKFINLSSYIPKLYKNINRFRQGFNNIGNVKVNKLESNKLVFDNIINCINKKESTNIIKSINKLSSKAHQIYILKKNNKLIQTDSTKPSFHHNLVNIPYTINRVKLLNKNNTINSKKFIKKSNCWKNFKKNILKSNSWFNNFNTKGNKRLQYRFNVKLDVLKNTKEKEALYKNNSYIDKTVFTKGKFKNIHHKPSEFSEIYSKVMRKKKSTYDAKEKQLYNRFLTKYNAVKNGTIIKNNNLSKDLNNKKEELYIFRNIYKNTNKSIKKRFLPSSFNETGIDMFLNNNTDLNNSKQNTLNKVRFKGVYYNISRVSNTLFDQNKHLIFDSLLPVLRSNLNMKKEALFTDPITKHFFTIKKKNKVLIKNKVLRKKELVRNSDFSKKKNKRILKLNFNKKTLFSEDFIHKKRNSFDGDLDKSNFFIKKTKDISGNTLKQNDFMKSFVNKKKKKEQKLLLKKNKKKEKYLERHRNR